MFCHSSVRRGDRNNSLQNIIILCHCLASSVKFVITVIYREKVQVGNQITAAFRNNAIFGEKNTRGPLVKDHTVNAPSGHNPKYSAWIQGSIFHDFPVLFYYKIRVPQSLPT